MTEAAIRIGSRGSALAMVQAGMVRDALVGAGHRAEIVVLETAGDRRAPDTAWGEGAFVGAIEVALRDGRIDVAVHSAKDVPTDEDPALRIAAYLPRADARDALVVAPGIAADRLGALPLGARVGTDSPRRAAFLAATRPDLDVRPLHGNVDTRLRRLDAGEADGLILACAGLDRLGRSDRIVERLDVEVMPPAPGQGAIAVQVRADDGRAERIVGSLDDAPTRAAVIAERAFLRATGGGCRAPIGAAATVDGGTLALRVAAAGIDGTGIVRGSRRGTAADPTGLGRALASELGLAPPRILVTRPDDQAADLVTALAAARLAPVVVPAIEVIPDATAIAAATSALVAADWVVVTSANGARAATAALASAATGDRRPRWAAVGPATRAVLVDAGIAVDLVPERATAGSLADALPVRAGERVVVLHGDLADPALVRRLRDRGARVDARVVYRTRMAPAASVDRLRAALVAGPLAAVVLTSRSTVHGLAALMASAGVDLRDVPVVCIGEPTAAAARAAGWTRVSVAPSTDAAALVTTALATIAHATTALAAAGAGATSEPTDPRETS